MTTWSDWESDRLRISYSRGMSIESIAHQLGRSANSIKQRIAAMGLASRKQPRLIDDCKHMPTPAEIAAGCEEIRKAKGHWPDMPRGQAVDADMQEIRVSELGALDD